MAMTEWTEPVVARMKEMWADGWSCSLIGNALGFSRNAVIGKVHRLKLPARRTVASAPRGRRPSQARLARIARIKKWQADNVPAPLPMPDPIIRTTSAWEPLPGSTPVSFDIATEGGCLWCVSDPFAPAGIPSLYCNEPRVDGTRWCRHHQARAWGAGTPFERSAPRKARRAADAEQWVPA